jgi:hypothetical protein
MFELLMFLFDDFDTRMGKFYLLNKNFNSYEHCQDYVDSVRKDNPNGNNQIYIPNNKVIGLTFCAPLDTHKNISYTVHVISDWQI